MAGMKKKVYGNPKVTKVFPKDAFFKAKTRASGFKRKVNPKGKAVKGKVVRTTLKQTLYLDRYGHIVRKSVRKV